MKVMDFSPANCKNCYKCLRTCPVKAIRMVGDQAVIDEGRCVGCGACFVVCPQNARSVVSDLDVVKQSISQGKKVIASVAPSYKGIYGDENGFVENLYALGFDVVEETGIGAEQVHHAYQKIISDNSSQNWITSCCPVVMDYVQKYHPDLAGNILPVLSPMAIHGKMLKKKHGEDAVVVFIGPCIAKKKEALALDVEAAGVDYVLTFEEMDLWKEEGEGRQEINRKAVRAGYIGGSFPLEKGIIGNLKTDSWTEQIAVAGFDMMDHAFKALKENEIGPCIIEANACIGGCANGPAIPRDRKKTVVNTLRLQKRMKSLDPTGEAGAEPAVETSCVYDRLTFEQKKPSDKAILDTLRLMGKFNDSDILNCSACGYDTCKDNAEAILNGMSHLQTCIPNMRTRAERMINSLFKHTPNGVLILDEQMRIIEFNPMAEKIFNRKSAEMQLKSVDILFDPRDFVQARTAQKPVLDKKVYLKEYGLSVSISVIFLPRQHLFLALLHNLTEEEKRNRAFKELRENTLDTAQTVINKQMRVAQEIASLLGETTAETKVALMKLQTLVRTDEGDER